jgi:predicted nucleic acid-binding protein
VTHVLLDINVVLDVLANREPFAADAEAVLAKIETGVIRGYVAAHTMTTLHFLASKHLGKAKARRVLTDLLQVLEVVSVDEDRLRYALGLNWTDFEDAVQAACAEKAEVDYLVTRDKTGFKRSAVKPVTPGEVLAIIGS